MALLAAPGVAAAAPVPAAPIVAAEAPAPRVRYIMPDFAADRNLIPRLDTRFLTAAFSVEMIGDWTNFAQNDASLAQVGRQPDAFEVRSARVRFTGGIAGIDRLTYTVAAQYRGFDVDPQRNWDVTDLSLAYRLDGNGSRITAGQIQETFSLEVIGATASMPQSERTLGPFAASRNIGISATYVFGPDRDWTASAGFYRDSFGFSGAGTGATARLTHLLWEDATGGRYLHLGGAWRHRPSDDGVIRYRGRPGSNVADNFVDTSEFPADGANHFGLEALWSDGAFSVLGEYVGAFVDAPAAGNPYFHGLYVIGSWVLTGEHRPYDRTRGLTRRIVPQGRWGAPELVARYSAVDLDGGSVRGGRYDRVDLGLNWWATTRWKLGILGGRTWLRRDGSKGTTDSVLTRVQYIF